MLLLQGEKWQQAGEELVLVSADYQTQGRGQRGNHWEAEAGKNLLLGLVAHPSFLPAAHQFALSEATALAVVAAIDRLGVTATIKWPNDIYYQDCKLGGMLLEHRLAGKHIASTIIGIGLNVNQTEFRSDAPNPCSLRQILGHTIDREALLRDFAETFQTYYDRLAAGDARALHSEYLSRLYRREGFFPYADAAGRFEAEVVDVAPDGILTLRDADGKERKYAFKEVQFILP